MKVAVGVIVVILVLGGAYYLTVDTTETPNNDAMMEGDTMQHDGDGMTPGVDDMAMPQQVTINITDDGAEPADVTINKGDTVIFTNSRSTLIWPATDIHPTHKGYPGSDIKTCGSPGAQNMFDSCGGVQPGDRYWFQFGEVGEWGWHDHLTPRIGGTITVE